MAAPPAPLPRLTACLSFDFDAVSLWLGADDLSTVSRGEFGATAIPRILALLARHDIPASFFIPGNSAETFPDVVRMIRDAGHEIGHHNDKHESPARLKSEEAERAVIERGFELLDRVAGVRPVGWRSPAAHTSDRTLSLLLDYGFVYDSSMMAHDYELYYARIGDRWAKGEPYVFGEPSALVEVPISWTLDDFPYFEYIPGKVHGLASPKAVEEIYLAEFDYAYRESPGGWMYNLVMHPQVIGRGHRMLLLERVIEHLEAHDVPFMRTIDYVEAWKAHHPAPAASTPAR